MQSCKKNRQGCCTIALLKGDPFEAALLTFKCKLLKCLLLQQFIKVTQAHAKAAFKAHCNNFL